MLVRKDLPAANISLAKKNRKEIKHGNIITCTLDYRDYYHMLFCSYIYGVLLQSGYEADGVNGTDLLKTLR